MTQEKTRSKTGIWLVGQQSALLTCRKLPSKSEVLAHYFYLHITKKKAVRISASLCTESLLEIWNKARIPTKLKTHVIAAIEKLYREWLKLKKNKNNKAKRSEFLKQKEDSFSNGLDSLFDIAHFNALELITIEEDKQFLLAQREDGRRGKMGDVDKKLSAIEDRRRERLIKAGIREEKEKAVATICKTTAVLTSSSDSESEQSVTYDESYQNTANSASTSKPQTKRGRKQLCSPSLASALDRTKVSDRNATILLASTAVSLGENIENYVINRSSIR